MFLDKEFWRVGANRVILGVLLLTTNEFVQNSRPSSEISYENREHEAATVIEEIGKLEDECRTLESRIEFLKRRNEAESILNPRNFILVGVLSFVIGFIFA